MHSSKKGNQRDFGMKAHIGVDAASGLVHSMAVTSGSESDVAHVHEVLHGDEEIVLGDAGYTGVEKRAEHACREVKWQIAEQPSRLARKVLEGSPAHEKLRRTETLKARMRALVEHPFHVLKCRFGHRKAGYRGLAKNAQQLYVAFGLANLLLVGRRCSTA